MKSTTTQEEVMSKSSHDPIIEKIESFIRRYVVLPADELRVVSHYVLHTHQFSERCEQPFTTPYLYIHSAQKGSGKTMLGSDILGVLVRNFQSSSNVTAATLFRLTESRVTLAIDEVDMLFSGRKADDDLVGVINTGYRRGGYVPRYDAKAEGQVRNFHTFGPKILIGIDNGMMADTTRERCIPIHMHRATEEERATVQMFLTYKIEDEIEELQTAIYDWSFEHTRGMRDYEPPMLENVTPRQWEITMPLLQVARTTGYEQELRQALVNIYAAQIQSDNSPEIDMLLTIQEMFEEGNTDRLTSTAIVTRLQNDPRFKSWNGKMLANKLAPFGIAPKPVRFKIEGVQRGYIKGDFTDAWERYL